MACFYNSLLLLLLLLFLFLLLPFNTTYLLSYSCLPARHPRPWPCLLLSTYLTYLT
jgi:hypothetical protein